MNYVKFHLAVVTGDQDGPDSSQDAIRLGKKARDTGNVARMWP